VAIYPRGRRTPSSAPGNYGRSESLPNVRQISDQDVLRETKESLSARSLGGNPVARPVGEQMVDEALANAIDQYGARWNDEFKKRGMLTVPTKNGRRQVVYDEMTRLKETSDWDALVRLAEPFSLHTVRGELAVDHYFDISIRHDTYGYATRRIGGNKLSGSAVAYSSAPKFLVADAIVSMKKELGFGSSIYGDLKGEKEVAPIAPAAQSQHHTCGKHGNQLVTARNEETGETALRCPVVGCTTILRKRRKSTLAG
jgi:hypothetical protein